MTNLFALIDILGLFFLLCFIVSVATFVVVMFVVFLIGVGVAIGGPILWRKFRTNGSYQEFRNTADA